MLSMPTALLPKLKNLLVQLGDVLSVPHNTEEAIRLIEKNITEKRYEQAEKIKILRTENDVLKKQVKHLQEGVRFYSGYNIRLNPFSQALLEKLAENNHLAFLDGEFVRDHLLDTELYETKMYTTRSPYSVKLKFKNFIPSMTDNCSFYDPVRHISLTCIIKRDLLAIAQEQAISINSLMCDAKGRILDPLNVLEDIWSDKLRLNGHATQQLKSSPENILDLLRLSFQTQKAIPYEYIPIISAQAQSVCTLPFKTYLAHLSKMFLRGFGEDLFSFIHQMPGASNMFKVIHPQWHQQCLLYSGQFKFIQESLRQLDDATQEIKFEYNGYAIMALFMFIPYSMLSFQNSPEQSIQLCINHLQRTFIDCDTITARELSKALNYWLPFWTNAYQEWSGTNELIAATPCASESVFYDPALLYSFKNQDSLPLLNQPDEIKQKVERQHTYNCN